MSNVNTLDNLGYREIDMLANLLKKYANAEFENENFLTNGVNWEYNPNSDNLFLVDEDYQVAMLNENDKLEQFNSCPSCGAEGFASELPINENGECKNCKKIN